MRTMRLRRLLPHSEKGFAFLVALALILGLTVLVTATQILVVQQLKTSKSEREYEHALQMAEAGVNAYLNRLNSGAAASYLVPALNASLSGPAPSLLGAKQAVQTGTYKMTRYPAASEEAYFAATIGAPAPPLYETKIVGYGWSHGVMRRVILPVRSISGDYAIYGIGSVDIQNNIRVTGNVGSNGQITMHNNDVINGHIALWGPGANATLGNNTPARLIRMPQPMVWATVDHLVLERWPNSGSTAPGGWGYLATHNDNASATVDGASGISGNVIDLNKSATVVLRGKAGGANYYVTNFYCKNNLTVTLDNALGPINLWIGPSGGSGGFDAKNNLTITQTSSDLANACRIYCGTAGTVNMKNNAGSIGIYAYNVVGGVAMGSVIIKNNAVVNGNIIANTVEMKNNETVNYILGPHFQPTNPWLVSTRWAEFE